MLLSTFANTEIRKVQNPTDHTGVVAASSANICSVFGSTSPESVTSRDSDCARAAAGPEVGATLRGLKMSAERDLRMSDARITINFRSTETLSTSGFRSAHFSKTLDTDSYGSLAAVGILLPVVCWSSESISGSAGGEADSSGCDLALPESEFSVSTLVSSTVSVFSFLTKISFSSPASSLTVTLTTTERI